MHTIHEIKHIGTIIDAKGTTLSYRIPEFRIGAKNLCHNQWWVWLLLKTQSAIKKKITWQNYLPRIIRVRAIKAVPIVQIVFTIVTVWLWGITSECAERSLFVSPLKLWSYAAAPTRSPSFGRKDGIFSSGKGAGATEPFISKGEAISINRKSIGKWSNQTRILSVKEDTV